METTTRSSEPGTIEEVLEALEGAELTRHGACFVEDEELTGDGLFLVFRGDDYPIAFRPKEDATGERRGWEYGTCSVCAGEGELCRPTWVPSWSALVRTIRGFLRGER